MLGKERWDLPGRDFQVIRDSDLITIKERGNNLQNGELTPSARPVGDTTKEYVCLQNGVSSAENLSIKGGTAQRLPRAAPEGNPLLIDLNHQLLEDKGDPLQPEPTSELGMLRSLKLEDECFA